MSASQRYVVDLCYCMTWNGLLMRATLQGKHVVFGKVIRGFDDVIPKIMAVPTDKKDKPAVPVVITNCGELELRAPAKGMCVFIIVFSFLFRSC
jgi:cyclophilin family peptidyl-prolyl cis-trans isomerase